MADKKTTIMVVKVDLQCPCCYKKTKKVLAKFPQIQNQAYDFKQNTVTITVVCCSPEKIRDKLCCKGGKTFKSIEILPPPKPKEPEKPKEKPPAPEKPKEKPPPPAPAPPPPEKPKEKPPPPPPPAAPTPAPPIYVPACPPMYPVPVCCGECYAGNPGGPCYEGYGRPVSSYDGYGYGYGYGGGNRCVSRCDEYFNEENASGCTII